MVSLDPIYLYFNLDEQTYLKFSARTGTSASDGTLGTSFWLSQTGAGFLGDSLGDLARSVRCRTRRQRKTTLMPLLRDVLWPLLWPPQNHRRR